MATEREIHGLDQAVVLLMFALDRVFAHRVEGWRRARRGFKLKVQQTDIANDLYVTILPVGLPKTDAIFARFMRFGRGWGCYEGTLSSTHSAKEIQGFAFLGDGAGNERATSLEHLIRPRHDEEKYKEIFARDANYNSQEA